MAESFGVEDRGHFYDPVGALRDVVVNHLMQLVALAAMEAPAGNDAETLKDAKFALFRSIEDANPEHYVRGQYDGYLDIDGVAKDSTTETYAALRLEIDNWRWAGVPWFIRTGKRLPVTQTELRVVFRDPPRLGFMEHGPPPPGAQPVRRQARPLDRRAAGPRRAPRRRRRPGGDHARHGVRRGGRRGADALRGAAARRDARRQHPLHPPGRRRRDLADLPAAARAAAAGASLRAGLVGSRGGRRARGGLRRLARAVGGRHEPAEAKRRATRARPSASEATPSGERARTADASAAERGDALAVPADRRLRVPLRLPHRRAGRPRRLDRLALRAALRRAERVRHPARPPGRRLPLRAVRDQRARRRASTSRGRTSC